MQQEGERRGSSVRSCNVSIWWSSYVLVYFRVQFRFGSYMEYDIFGEGSHISTNQRRESTVFSLLIG